MSGDSLDQAASRVLGRYPALLRPSRVTPLGNAGGFSGARLWQVQCSVGPVCLRAWPVDGIAPESLTKLHDLMRRAREADLLFVPKVHATSDGATWVAHEGRLWEVTAWQPGHADFEANPSPARLRTACVALGQLHAAWASSMPMRGACPAVQRRLARFREWSSLIASGWRGPLEARADALIHPWAQRAWGLLLRWMHRVPALLESWIARPLPLQPCLCDVWHDHLLFDGDTLTGLIDYGAVKHDHVAVDLSRLFGSLVGDDRAAWTIGVDAYRSVHALSAEEEALANMLDQTGTILGAANWLLWLYRDQRVYEDGRGVARRLAALVQRMERWV